MPEEDPHRLCKNETKVSILEERAAGAAMALVLSEKVRAAENRTMMWMIGMSVMVMLAVIGWGIAIFGIMHR